LVLPGCLEQERSGGIALVHRPCPRDSDEAVWGRRGAVTYMLLSWSRRGAAVRGAVVFAVV
jgi:hypothetical protein